MHFYKCRNYGNFAAQVDTPHTYRTLRQASEGTYSESGSKFLAFAWPVHDDERVKQCRETLLKAHHKAVHVVWASRIGYDTIMERSSDDGEPSGSAGKPVLNVLRAHQLTNSTILVVRYFGGKKLGIPGLINAYRSAAEEAVNRAGIRIVTIFEHMQVTCAMADMQTVLHQLNKAGARVNNSTFEEICTFNISIARERYEQFQASVKDLWQAQIHTLGNADQPDTV